MGQLGGFQGAAGLDAARMLATLASVPAAPFAPALRI